MDSASALRPCCSKARALVCFRARINPCNDLFLVAAASRKSVSLAVVRLEPSATSVLGNDCLTELRSTELEEMDRASYDIR